MKPLTIAFLTIFGLSLQVHSQEKQPTPPTTTTARLLGTIPDGTPPPPEAPKPEFIVRSRDILDTTTLEQGGRTITLQEIKPIDLPPPPPEPILAAPAAPDPAFAARLADFQATHPRSALLFLSATVYRSKDHPPRTLVHWWPRPGGESINFWSSADFSLIAGGIRSFADSAGATHFLSIGWGYVDLDKISTAQTAKGKLSIPPTIPDFPAGKATVAYIAKAPSDDDLLVIQSLHDLYNKNHDQLLTAYQGRTQARLAAEAELKAHPPQPKDITLNFWRIGGGETSPENGGVR